jgi:hypothetical protein
MDFVDQILPGIDEYYMCRQKDCSMVCQATNWVNNSPNYQFRCPACGEQYRPWKDQSGYWPTNKVIFTYDEVNLQSGRAVLAAGSSDGTVGPNLVNVYPVIWPDTSTEQMKARIKAIFLDIDQDLLALEPKDRLGFVLENLSATAPHKAFQQFEFKPSTRAIIDDLNVVMGPKKKVAVRAPREGRLLGAQARGGVRLARAPPTGGLPSCVGSLHVARGLCRQKRLGDAALTQQSPCSSHSERDCGNRFVRGC